MHVHLGLLEALKIFFYVIIIGFFWRTVAMIFKDQGHENISNAMLLLY